jgi:UDPglucose 6-dehydrogenase
VTNTPRKYDVAVIGDWHLAFVTASCLADAGHRIALVNPMGTWSEFPQMPVHEPGIPEMINQARATGNLAHESGINGQWTAEIVWMAVDTPVTEQDEPQVAPLLEIAAAVNKHLQPRIFALSSQVPIGFCQKLETVLGAKIAYIPENLRLGQGINTFAKADRTVIGGSTTEVAEAIKNLLKTFQTQFLLCDLPTSEMVKHANNAFLATSISFANEMARIGARFGVDSYLVAQALKLDARIGPKAYVAPGLGFAGGTLPRDLRVLEKLGKENDIPTPLTSAVLEINSATSDLVAEVVAQAASTTSNNKVLILGYTYKADTDTLRRSLSIEIAQKLRALGLECHGFDPFMNGKDLQPLKGAIEHHEHLSDTPACSVALLMTARPMFREQNWSEWQSANGSRTVFIDTQNGLNSEAVMRAGFRYRPLWAPAKDGGAK